MKATGEVMAIDRTFGSALNKALRGLEQAGAGPLAEDPSWARDLRLPRRGLRRRPGRRTTTADPLGRRGRPGLRIDPARPADRRARSCCAGSSSRPTPGCGGSSGCSGAACRRRSSARRPGIAAWFLAEMGRNVALEAEVAGDGRAPGRSGGRRRPPSCSRRSSGPASATGSWPSWPARRRTRSGRPGWRSACGPGYAMVDTCAAEFAAETPYFYSTYAAAGSAPEAPPVARPAALVIGSGRSGSGRGSSSTTARSRRPTRFAGRAGRR